MTDDQTLKLSPIFNRCLIDLECIGNFDLRSGDREQAMQVLMDTVDAAVNVVNNSPMDSIDVEIGKLEDEIVEAAVFYHKRSSERETTNRLDRAVDALLIARKKAEHETTSC